VHAPSVHAGFQHDDPEFESARRERADLVRRFLAAMDRAGGPGLKRKLGSTVLQLTGQPTQHYWSAVLTDAGGHHREVLIFDDGSHGWSDEITYSRRPRTPEDEIPADLLRVALEKILTANGLDWPTDDMPAPTPRAASPVEERESPQEYFRHRELEYAAMMALRMLCLIGAVAVVALGVPYAPLWMALFLVGIVLLPMVAVVVANDHHPRLRGHHWFGIHRPRAH
jgi:hypothetical protein